MAIAQAGDQGPRQGRGPASAERTVQSVARAAQLLKALGQAPRPATLSDLARKVGLSKSATYNLLMTLETEGLIAKDSDARYRLHWGMYELGSAVVRANDLTRLARFHLDRLAAETGEAVLLGILDGDTVLYLDRGQASTGFGMVANVGRRSALHSNASGKILLAFQDPEFVQDYGSRGLAAFTSNTITDPELLGEELATIARRGYATCWEEREVGISSISVPVLNQDGKVHAAMTVAAPANRLGKRTLSRYLVPLQAEAAAVSGELGWSRPRV